MQAYFDVLNPEADPVHTQKSTGTSAIVQWCNVYGCTPTTVELELESPRAYFMFSSLLRWGFLENYVLGKGNNVPGSKLQIPKDLGTR